MLVVPSAMPHTIFCCSSVGAKVKPLPITAKMGALFSSGVASSGRWFWFGLGAV